jgi:uncharacterized membrane protein required for colicin V production
MDALVQFMCGFLERGLTIIFHTLSTMLFFYLIFKFLNYIFFSKRDKLARQLSILKRTVSPDCVRIKSADMWQRRAK